MIISDEAAMIILALIALIVICISATFLFGAYLVSRGNYIVGMILAAVAVAIVSGPGAYDRLHNISVRADIDSRISMPDRLELSGKKVLFIETDNDLCSSICEKILEADVDAEFYHISVDMNAWREGSENHLTDVLNGDKKVNRIHMVREASDVYQNRYPDIMSPGGPSEYDLVILIDDTNALSFLAPDLQGGPLPLGVRSVLNILVFTDWSDPFADLPPAPDYRLVIGDFRERELVRIPFLGGLLASSYVSYPDHREENALLDRLVCASIGKEVGESLSVYDELSCK